MFSEVSPSSIRKSASGFWVEGVPAGFFVGDILLEPAALDVRKMLDDTQQRGPRRHHRFAKQFVRQTGAHFEQRLAVVIEESDEYFSLVPATGVP